VNSFNANWGANGIFFAPNDGTINRFGNGFIILDVPENISAIIAKFEGKDFLVTGTPDHYRLEGGKARKYRDEIVFWCAGRLFGVDIFEMTPDEFEAVPKGPEVTIEETPFKTRELVRQIRQSVGLK